VRGISGGEPQGRKLGRPEGKAVDDVGPRPWLVGASLTRGYFGLCLALATADVCGARGSLPPAPLPAVAPQTLLSCQRLEGSADSPTH
jgi:hypothetical protein